MASENSDPPSDYKTLLRLTLEAGRAHAETGAQLAAEVGQINDQIAKIDVALAAYLSRESERAELAQALRAWLEGQHSAAQAARAAAEVGDRRPGFFERAWTSITTSLESATTRTALLAVIIPILSVLLNKAPGCAAAASALDTLSPPVPAADIPTPIPTTPPAGGGGD